MFQIFRLSLRVDLWQQGNILISSGTGFWNLANLFSVVDSSALNKVNESLPNSVNLYINNNSQLFAHEAFGFHVFPGGLILNWGQFSIPAYSWWNRSYSTNVAFRKPFTQQIFGAWLGVENAAGQEIGTTNKTLQGMQINKGNGDPSARSGTWFAIGK